jgi:hypothetical protein
MPCSLLAAALVAAAACRSAKTITGGVYDFDSARPLGHVPVRVVQSGWGVSGGGLVWDKEYVSTDTTDAKGAFRVRYRVGGSANVIVAMAGYNEFRHGYEPASEIRIRLKAIAADAKVLPTGFLRLGEYVDGRVYGWDFASAQLTTTADGADLIPDSIATGDRGFMRIRAPGKGGIRFVAQAALGVDGQFLVYSGSAPDTGYLPVADLDFAGDGGVYFVRTRDGAHYAKFEFTPSAIGWTAARDIRRDLMLRYVYNPTGSPDLRHNEPPLRLW